MSMLKNDLNSILQKDELKKGIEKYLYIMKAFHYINVFEDHRFRSKYIDFFSMGRKSKNYYDAYFALLESAKTNPVTFSEALRYLYKKTNEYHCSFGSKLIHILNPEEPIWDDIVTNKHFNFDKSKITKDKEIRFIQMYNDYREAFFNFRSSEEGKKIIQAFDNQFPEYVNIISDTKKIDFVLWQDR